MNLNLMNKNFTLQKVCSKLVQTLVKSLLKFDSILVELSQKSVESSKSSSFEKSRTELQVDDKKFRKELLGVVQKQW